METSYMLLIEAVIAVTAIYYVCVRKLNPGCQATAGRVRDSQRPAVRRRGRYNEGVTGRMPPCLGSATPSPAAFSFYGRRTMNGIYLDNNATTPLLPAVWEAMRPFLTETYGNPASAHWAGRRARQALEDARERTAAILGAEPDEVIFTSGATEANNLALFGLAGQGSGHLISSPIEHPSVTEPIERLVQHGFLLDKLPVDHVGIVRAEAVAGLLRPDTRLVSVMYANNETGAIQPVAELAAQLPRGIAFHCDAAQAAGKLPLHFHTLGVTTLALSAHKFHGPKGIGVLLVHRSAQLAPQLFGGHQQQGRRPGTEAVALAVGLARALELAQQEQPSPAGAGAPLAWHVPGGPACGGESGGPQRTSRRRATAHR